MIIIGELINASRSSVRSAIELRDKVSIQKLAKDQADAGAHYIDVNAGVFVDEETRCLEWLVKTVQEEIDLPCCIDSPNPAAIEIAISAHKGTPMINSISLEESRSELLNALSGSGCKIVALCMSDDGMPKTADERMLIAESLIQSLLKNNIPADDIYVDPLVQPIATNQKYGYAFLTTISRIGIEFSEVNTICGMSNISFGLPARTYLNHIFMIMAVTAGLDAAIVNPLDKAMMSSIVAAETLIGKDDYCTRYLEFYRSGLLESIQ